MSKQRYRLAVGLSAMRDSDNQDHQFIRMDVIEHPVHAHSEPSCSIELPRQEPTRIRILGEGIDGASYPVPVSPGDCSQSLPGAPLNPYRKAHA